MHLPKENIASIPYENLLGLILRLQENLIIDEVLKVTYEWLSESVAVCGLSYESEGNSPIVCGTRSNFNYKYDIDDSGVLIVFYSINLSDTQKEQLGNVIRVLLNVFRGSINYTKAISSSMIDYLTKVGNRNALEQDLKREISLLKRKESNTSTLLLFDLDKFKQVNDQLGHVEGDDLLVKISSTLKDLARNSDLIYRFGGDEFLMLLRGTNLSGAMQMAERLRESINEALIPYNKKVKDYRVSVSIGITEVSADDDTKTLLDRVDGALYSAKNSGGDKALQTQIKKGKTAS